MVMQKLPVNLNTNTVNINLKTGDTDLIASFKPKWTRRHSNESWNLY